MFPEILAPAGGPEQLEAAVRSGADAVYLGLTALNARNGAVNFAPETLGDTVSYCRVRGVKVYVTLNTLFKDGETAEAVSLLRACAAAGVDAVLIQDLGMLRLIKLHCPDMPVHASTQMTVHNVSGAKVCEELGFRRIVLARELTLEEIRKVTASVGIETEVFVHGAQCMSISGTCLMSSVLGGRSGNRGRCAQPCRLNFRTKERQYALSLKDMCLAGHVEELRDAGVASFKIEGRLKRPEYVAAAVTAYRNALRGEEYDTDGLRAVFSRSGFTDGFLTGKRDVSMFGVRTKEDVNASAAVLRGMHELYKRELGRIEVSAEVSVNKDGSRAVFTDGTNTVAVDGAVPAPSGSGIDEEKIRASFEKTGNTPYIMSSVKCAAAQGLYMSASELNDLRRRGLDALTAERGRPAPYVFTEAEDGLSRNISVFSPEIRLRFEKASQVFDAECPVILPAGQIIKYHGELAGLRPIAEVRRFVFPEYEDEIARELSELRALGVTDVIADGIGELAMAKKAGFRVHGGFGLNLLNSHAVRMYRDMGIEDAVMSPELSAKGLAEIRSLLRLGLITYGRLPLMNYRVCPVRESAGCAGCTGQTQITDRLGNSFTVICRAKKYSTLLNSVPLYVGDKKIDGAGFSVLYFTTETRDECRRIYKLARDKKPLPGKKTGGLYFRELL